MTYHSRRLDTVGGWTLHHRHRFSRPFSLPRRNLSADLREKLQETLGSAYSITRELGGGGMSRVLAIPR